MSRQSESSIPASEVPQSSRDVVFDVAGLLSGRKQTLDQVVISGSEVESVAEHPSDPVFDVAGLLSGRDKTLKIIVPGSPVPQVHEPYGAGADEAEMIQRVLNDSSEHTQVVTGMGIGDRDRGQIAGNGSDGEDGRVQDPDIPVEDQLGQTGRWPVVGTDRVPVDGVIANVGAVEPKYPNDQYPNIQMGEMGESEVEQPRTEHEQLRQEARNGLANWIQENVKALEEGVQGVIDAAKWVFENRPMSEKMEDISDALDEHFSKNVQRGDFVRRRKLFWSCFMAGLPLGVIASVGTTIGGAVHGMDISSLEQQKTLVGAALGVSGLMGVLNSDMVRYGGFAEAWSENHPRLARLARAIASDSSLGVSSIVAGAGAGYEIASGASRIVFETFHALAPHASDVLQQGQAGGFDQFGKVAGQVVDQARGATEHIPEAVAKGRSVIEQATGAAVKAAHAVGPQEAHGAISSVAVNIPEATARAHEVVVKAGDTLTGIVMNAGGNPYGREFTETLLRSPNVQLLLGQDNPNRDAAKALYDFLEQNPLVTWRDAINDGLKTPDGRLVNDLFANATRFIKPGWVFDVAGRK